MNNEGERERKIERKIEKGSTVKHLKASFCKVWQFEPSRSPSLIIFSTAKEGGIQVAN